MSKFSSELAEELYARASEGFTAESTGSVHELGWFGLFFNDSENGEGFGGHILREDNYGFVTVESYESETELVREWSNIEDDCERFYDDWSSDV